MAVEFIGRVLSIVVIDLVLSGDNAVVIGMAARRLPSKQRRRAIVFGGGAAVVLRILFTATAALLLCIPLLEAGGGVLLLWIALKLLRQDEQLPEHVAESTNMLEAIRTIVMADVIMSLDNILAVGGAAHGHLWLLLFGLALSIPLLLVGSSLIATLMNRFAWLIWLGAGILTWTAGRMIVEDGLVEKYVLHSSIEAAAWLAEAIPLVVMLSLLGIALVMRRRADRPPLGPGRAEVDGHGA